MKNLIVLFLLSCNLMVFAQSKITRSHFTTIDQLFDINLDCYSIKSFDKNYDETNLINKTIKKYGLKHKYIPADKNFSYSNISNIIKDGAYPISSITFLLYFFA